VLQAKWQEAASVGGLIISGLPIGQPIEKWQRLSDRSRQCDVREMRQETTAAKSILDTPGSAIRRPAAIPENFNLDEGACDP
jgi:hypothetical protein